MYPRQSGYPVQPTGTVQQPAVIVTNQPPVVLPAIPPAQSEERAKITKATIIMGVSIGMAMVLGITAFSLIANASVQTAFGNFGTTLSIIFFSIGGALGFIAICLLVVGLIYLQRVRKLEAELKKKQQESRQLPGQYFPSF